MMRRFGIHSALILTLTLGSLACSRMNGDPAARGDSAGDGDELTVTGCLTSAPDRSAFAVTPVPDALTTGTLARTSGEVPTFTYELVGGTDLQAHVGREVSIKGRLEDDNDQVDVDTKDKVELPATRSGDDTVTPAIETKTEAKIHVRRLHVVSVTPTGQPCQSSE